MCHSWLLCEDLTASTVFGLYGIYCHDTDNCKAINWVFFSLCVHKDVSVIKEMVCATADQIMKNEEEEFGRIHVVHGYTLNQYRP